MLVFDLDPGAPADIVQCCEVALVLRGLFGQLGLESVAKTSGSKGLQIYVPLNGDTSYEQTKPFARRIAELLEARMSELVVSRMTKRLRPGKVLVDWSQNDAHKTTVTVYSIRARERPTVSAPVGWDEVQRCHEEQDAGILTFEAMRCSRASAGRAIHSRCCSARSRDFRASDRRPPGELGCRSDGSDQLRNRLLVATGMWKEATGEPLPRLAPGDPETQIESFELQLVNRLWETATPENARDSRTAPGTWSTTGPIVIRSSSA